METFEATGQMGMLNQLYNLHGLGPANMTIYTCATFSIQNPHRSVCMHAHIFSLQFLGNQPVPFASTARLSTGGLCSG